MAGMCLWRVGWHIERAVLCLSYLLFIIVCEFGLNLFYQLTQTGGDKFGNVYVSRLPKEFVEDVEDTSAAAISTSIFNNQTNKVLLDMLRGFKFVGGDAFSVC